MSDMLERERSKMNPTGKFYGSSCKINWLGNAQVAFEESSELKSILKFIAAELNKSSIYAEFVVKLSSDYESGKKYFALLLQNSDQSMERTARFVEEAMLQAFDTFGPPSTSLVAGVE